MKKLSVHFVNDFGDQYFNNITKLEIEKCSKDGCDKQEIIIHAEGQNGIIPVWHLDDISLFECFLRESE